MFLLQQPERKNTTVLACSTPVSKGLAISLISKGKIGEKPSRGRRKSTVGWQKEVIESSDT